LLALNAYLLDGNEKGEPGNNTDGPVAVGPWREGEFRLFLSHTSDHRVFANEVAKALRRVRHRRFRCP
jgi:hypothetical protein